MAAHFLADTAVLTGRTMRHVTRSMDTVITTAVTPVAIMLLFVYVFGGAINTGPVPYVTYLLPGILLITIASGVSYTALRLFTDMRGGIFERLRSLPIARSGVLWAHVLTSLAANVISLALVVAVAVGLGFRSDAGPASTGPPRPARSTSARRGATTCRSTCWTRSPWSPSRGWSGCLSGCASVAGRAGPGRSGGRSRQAERRRARRPDIYVAT